MEHITDQELELHLRGKIRQAQELARIEGHLLKCPDCNARSEQTETYLKILEVVVSFTRHED